MTGALPWIPEGAGAVDAPPQVLLIVDIAEPTADLAVLAELIGEILERAGIVAHIHFRLGPADTDPNHTEIWICGMPMVVLDDGLEGKLRRLLPAHGQIQDDRSGLFNDLFSNSRRQSEDGQRIRGLWASFRDYTLGVGFADDDDERDRRADALMQDLSSLVRTRRDHVDDIEDE